MKRKIKLRRKKSFAEEAREFARGKPEVIESGEIVDGRQEADVEATGRSLPTQSGEVVDDELVPEGKELTPAQRKRIFKRKKAAAAKEQKPERDMKSRLVDYLTGE